MARDGYVTLEDLACRWTTAEVARAEFAKDLKFREGENGFDDKNSSFTAMRVYQALLQAKHIFQTGTASGTAIPGAGTRTSSSQGRGVARRCA